MSEIIVTADALRDGPPAPVRQLRGNLGVASIVFMVVAAAAPLGVIGGVVPLGIASGNGAGFPATFIISTVILLFFAVGFTAKGKSKSAVALAHTKLPDRETADRLKQYWSERLDALGEVLT